jgi:hypothetical protein
MVARMPTLVSVYIHAYIYTHIHPQATDLKTVPTLVLKNCSDGHYTINRRLTKLMVSGCDNVTVVLNGVILTRVAEVCVYLYE